MVDRRQRVLAFVLAVTAASGLLANDIFLPILPSIGQSLDVNVGSSQFLLIHFLIVMGVTHLIYAPLTERFGEKRILMAGLVLFAASSAGMAMSSDYIVIVALRTIQAAGVSMCLALSRTIMRTQLDPQKSAHGFLLMATIMGVVPGVVPSVGSILFGRFGLAGCFVFSAVFAIAILLLVAGLMPSSSRPDRSNPAPVVKRTKEYLSTANDIGFWRQACIPCFAYSAYFAYVCASPYILVRAGLTTLAVALSYAPMSASYFIASRWARRYAARNDTETALSIGHVAFLAGGLACWWVLSQSLLVPLHLVAAASLLTFGNGFLLPLGTAGAMARTAPTNGMPPPALLGYSQFTLAAASAFLGTRLFALDDSYLGAWIALVCIAGAATHLWIRVSENMQSEQRPLEERRSAQ